MNENLLKTTLQAAVPLWINDFQQRPWSEVEAAAQEAQEVIGSRGDNLLFRSPYPGGTAEAFNALAKGIACLSFLPGGVTAFGVSFDATHPEQQEKL